VRFDAETLEMLGDYAYSPTIGGSISIAHPHHDAKRGCQFSYVVEFGLKSRYRLFAIDDNGGVERVVAEMLVARPAYMHSFAMTERYFRSSSIPCAFGSSSNRSSAITAGALSVDCASTYSTRTAPAC
jgi:carotenoid cleavage dioxygenase-like enzyme